MSQSEEQCRISSCAECVDLVDLHIGISEHLQPGHEQAAHDLSTLCSTADNCQWSRCTITSMM
ncbi:uncharacterized protein K489DRAFT_379751 [Dissoconium aciculare CBS 342.82]|uniref:Uncharacterized protein n=1 Tax=Dissoconium aciculare CBS 342.82 TaxID=1314786 RepID=A0A6J3M6Q9_9PEZI|nr:uncharacterized protein K489DRAFT_379751 [Dissoconium aciculare CBS 342.82]KAF1823756.1 hypothetical protein K489DRAFT_379751 [Dissoconium aciculare CBS 342.82]